MLELKYKWKSGHVNQPEQAQSSEQTPPSSPKKRFRFGWLLDITILLLMSGFLFAGASIQFKGIYTDMGRYHCYATAFWHGLSALKTLPTKQCAFIQSYGAGSEVSFVHRLEARGLPESLGNLILNQKVAYRFRVLPPEYPLLTLVPFSLGMIVAPQWYRIAFALWMIAFAWGTYFVLKHHRSRSAAIAFAIYMAIGSYATGAARFDIIASGLTLLALLAAGRSRWRWAFMFLALATMLKLYPVILVIPFVIAQQMQSKQPWLSWQRWKALGLFILTCSALLLVSLLLNVQGTFGPFSYFTVRPLQIESFPATLIWLSSFMGNPIHFVNSFGSTNIVGWHEKTLSMLSTISLAIGLMITYYFQLRGKINLMMACLLTLLVVIVTGKVFSPQYLIWVTPMIAYIGKCNWRWLLSWTAVGFMTTCVYPFIYLSVSHVVNAPRVPAFYPLVISRNFLILGIVAALMFTAARVKNPQQDLLGRLFNKFKRQHLVDLADKVTTQPDLPRMRGAEGV